MRIALLLFWLLVLIGNTFAQGAIGSVTGLVLDPTGSAVPRATLTLRNLATQEEASSVSTDAGAFNFPSVKIGTYHLTVEADGFKRAVT
jgi:hypothetical protein